MLVTVDFLDFLAPVTVLFYFLAPVAAFENGEF